MKKTRIQADWNELERREAHIKADSKFLSHLSVSLFALVLTIGLFQFDFETFQGFLTDALFRTQPRPKTHPSVALVAYDEIMAANYQGSKKIPAPALIKTISKLNQYEPLAIAIIAPINEKLYSETELSQMSESFSQVSNMYIGYTDSESLGKNAPRALYHTAHYLPGYISRDTFSYGADSVSRRIMLSIDGIPSVYTRLASLFLKSSNAPDNYPAHRIEKFGDTTHTYINWQGPKGSYPITHMSDFLQNETSDKDFKGKIVLIGTVLESNKDTDFIFTPYSRTPFQTTLLEGAAHSLATLLNQNGLYKTSRWFNIIFCLILGVLSANLVLALSPRNGLVFLGTELALLFALAWVALNRTQCLLDIAHPSLVVFISYYFVIPYRLVEEYKKRWHYQEKSEFMAQLEQLKTNFLSLVSHDLKTPLAQIQGNAELVLGDHLLNQNPKQKNSLQSIIEITESLTNYVDGILNLTRIEGSKVHLNKTSKDINTLIKEVIKTKLPLAQSKDINIQINLEPLFSFKFDVKLIQQVISNLVENAIKYSPSGTTILLESREENSLVKVSVKDQGYGIPEEEQEKIFTKFYRIPTENTQNEKGTGLGLYLVKYFVELHSGFVTLVSQQGEGSTFMISLPTSEDAL